MATKKKVKTPKGRIPSSRISDKKLPVARKKPAYKDLKCVTPDGVFTFWRCLENGKHVWYWHVIEEGNNKIQANGGQPFNSRNGVIAAIKDFRNKVMGGAAVNYDWTGYHLNDPKFTGDYDELTPDANIEKIPEASVTLGTTDANRILLSPPTPPASVTSNGPVN